jgi:hypothetical protein
MLTCLGACILYWQAEQGTERTVLLALLDVLWKSFMAQNLDGSFTALADTLAISGQMDPRVRVVRQTALKEEQAQHPTGRPEGGAARCTMRPIAGRLW